MACFIITKISCSKEQYRAGSYNQFSGDEYFFNITIGTIESDMDSPLKSVRFEGGGCVHLELDSEDRYCEGATSYWDFEFSIATFIMGMNSTSSYAGKFIFETENGTIYTFEDNGKDFVFNKSTACEMLANMQQVLNF